MNDVGCMKIQIISKLAFTLAEVVIVIGIIGIIAEITIPTLIVDTKEKATVVGLKKVYSCLLNGYERAVLEDGQVKDWNITGTSSQKATALFAKFSPYLNIAKDCGTSGGCFASAYYRLNGTADPTGATFNTSSSFATAKLADGSIILFWASGVNAINILVDTNGDKAPNTYGRDTFWFELSSIYPLRPYHGWTSRVDSDATSICDITDAGASALNGRGCTAWVLSNENLDYLHCSDLAWGSKVTCD